MPMCLRVPICNQLVNESVKETLEISKDGLQIGNLVADLLGIMLDSKSKAVSAFNYISINII